MHECGGTVVAAAPTRCIGVWHGIGLGADSHGRGCECASAGVLAAGVVRVCVWCGVPRAGSASMVAAIAHDALRWRRHDCASIHKLGFVALASDILNFI